MLAMRKMQEELMAGLKSELTATRSELRAETAAIRSENATFRDEMRREVVALNDRFDEEEMEHSSSSSNDEEVDTAAKATATSAAAKGTATPQAAKGAPAVAKGFFRFTLCKFYLFG